MARGQVACWQGVRRQTHQRTARWWTDENPRGFASSDGRGGKDERRGFAEGEHSGAIEEASAADIRCGVARAEVGNDFRPRGAWTHGEGVAGGGGWDIFGAGRDGGTDRHASASLGGCTRGKHHVWRRRRAVDLGPSPDYRATGQIGGRTDPRSAGLLPCRPPHFPGFGGDGRQPAGADAVVPRASYAAAEWPVAARCRGVNGTGRLERGAERREREGPHGDRILAEAWRSGALAVSDFSQDGPSLGQR